MYNLLISEYLKIKKNTVLKLLIAGIVVLSIALSINNVYNMIQCYSSPDQIESYAGMSMFCGSLAMGHEFYYISILLCVFGGIYICYDFERKLCQSAVSAGCKKSNIFFSKMIIYFIIVSVVMLIYAAISTIIPSIVFKDYIKYNSSMILDMIKIYFICIIYHFARVSPIILVAYLLRKTGLTIIVWGIVYAAVDNIWKGITEITTNLDIIYDNSIWQIHKTISPNMPYSDIFKVLVMCSVYIIIYWGLSI